MIDTDSKDALTSLEDIRNAVSLALESAIFHTHDLPFSTYVLKFPISRAINDDYGDNLDIYIQPTVDKFINRETLKAAKVVYNRNQRPPLYFLLVEVTLEVDFYGEPYYCSHRE